MLLHTPGVLALCGMIALIMTVMLMMSTANHHAGMSRGALR